MQVNTTDADAAVATLSHLGYTYHGGEHWNPPRANLSPEVRDEMAKLVTEAELASKAVAPRVTPADLEAAIDSTWYFTAEQGCHGAAAAGTPYEVQPPVGAKSSLRLLTMCVLVLQNGFTVVGTSACASPENFDADIGKRVAREDALRQLWPLLGYQLRSTLFMEGA